MLTLSQKIKKESQGKNEENNNENRTFGHHQSNKEKKIAIRDKLLIKEVQEMEANLPVTCSIKFLNINELHRFELIVIPNESFWSGGHFVFNIEIPDDYNFVPPLVKCQTRIYHPNISEDGDICLSLLRQNSIDGLGWAPTRTLKDVVWGINSLFSELYNFDDPLNETAADHYHKDRESFKLKVVDYIEKYAK